MSIKKYKAFLLFFGAFTLSGTAFSQSLLDEGGFIKIPGTNDQVMKPVTLSQLDKAISEKHYTPLDSLTLHTDPKQSPQHWYVGASKRDAASYCKMMGLTLLSLADHGLAYKNLLNADKNVTDYGWPWKGHTPIVDVKTDFYSANYSDGFGDLENGLVNSPNEKEVSRGLIVCWKAGGKN